MPWFLKLQYSARSVLRIGKIRLFQKKIRLENEKGSEVSSDTWFTSTSSASGAAEMRQFILIQGREASSGDGGPEERPAECEKVFSYRSWNS